MKCVGEQSDRIPFRQCIFIWGCQSSIAPAKKHSKTIRERGAFEMALASRTIFCRRYSKGCIERYRHSVAVDLCLLKELCKFWLGIWCEPMLMILAMNTTSG